MIKNIVIKAKYFLYKKHVHNNKLYHKRVLLFKTFLFDVLQIKSFFLCVIKYFGKLQSNYLY